MPDPYKDGLMPTVLKFIDYAVAHSDLPGLTDMNSVLEHSAADDRVRELFLVL